jgi:hypothetical protein
MKYKDQFIKIGNEPVIQITKKKAETLYNAGKAIFLNPCNMRLNSAWSCTAEIKKKEDENISFKLICSYYESYNCVKELGRYPNYFTNPENLKP